MSRDALAPQAEVQVDLIHSLVHDGKVFVVSDYDGDVDNADPKYWYILTAVGYYPHIQIAVSVSAAGIIELFEAGTETADGTEITPVNMNRNSASTASTKFFYDPTVTADGTLIDREYVPGGDRLQTRVGTQARTEAEWVFKAAAATNYFLKFTPDADATKIAIEIEFYEKRQGTP